MRLRNRVLRKLLSRQLSGWSSGTVAEQRARQAKSNRFIRLPGDVDYRSVSINGTAAEWIAAPDANAGVILYLHGGAYALGVTAAHRELAGRLVRATETRLLMLEYGLAPERPFPAGLDDVLSAYRWLLDQGTAADRIIIGGDSAGGGLALAALIALRDAADPLPAAAICISPWTDLALTGASMHSKAAADPILDGDSLKMYARYYAGDEDVTAPLISPLYADLNGLPPMLIHVGTEEILLDDATRFADRAIKAGGTAALQVWDEMFHVFHLLSFLPESKKAVGHIADFVTNALAARPADRDQRSAASG